MKSQIFNTFFIVLVAQSQVAFAEPEPILNLLGGVISDVTDGLDDAVSIVTDLGGNIVAGLTGGLPSGNLLDVLLGDDGLVGGLLDDEGLLGGILGTVLDLVETTLLAVLELLNNLLGGFDSGLIDIIANALNTLGSSSGSWNDTLEKAPLVIQKAVDDAQKLASNITDTLSSSINDAIGNQLTLDSSIIDALKQTLNSIANDFVIPDIIDKILVTFSNVTCSVFNAVLNLLVKIPNIPEGVTDAIENTCPVLDQILFDFMNQILDVVNPSLEPLKTIAPLLLDNLKSIVTATGVSDLIQTNPDISTIKIPLTSTINDLLLTLVANLNTANGLLQQAKQPLNSTSNATPDTVDDAHLVAYTLVPNTNCSNNIESHKARLTDSSKSNTTECINTAITSLQGIVNQYTSIVNDINTSISTGFLKATSLDLYIKTVANSGAVIFNIIFGVGSCLANGSGLSIAEFAKLIMDSIHCLADQA